MVQTNAKTRAIAHAVKEAQQLASADGRSYLVTRGPGRERPWVTPLAGLEQLAAYIADGIAAGSTFIVPPQGTHAGLTPTEILAAEVAAVERANIEQRLRLDAAFRARHL